MQMNGQPGKLAIRIPAFLVEPDVMLLVNDPNRWATEKWQYESAMQGFPRRLRGTLAMGMISRYRISSSDSISFSR